MSRVVHLDEHVGKVDAGLWATYDDTCVCPVWLTDRDRYTILSHLLPYAEWSTRFVHPLERGVWMTASDEEYFLFLESVKNLTVKLTGGDAMGCNQAMADALNNIASALSRSGGGGSATCYGGIADCMNRYTDDEFLDTEPPAVDPNGQTPPEGFDTMQEYLIYKCQAAYLIHGWLVGFARGITGWGSFSFTVNSIGAVLAALLGALGVIVFPPAAFVAVVGAVVALGALSAGAFAGGSILADYFAAHKMELICQLYSSGNAADALTAIAGFVEDALQSAEMAGFLGGLPSGAGEAIGAVFGAAQSNSLVAPLFRLYADLAFPGADCEACEEPPAGLEWHFDADEEGWVFTSEYGSPGNSYDSDWLTSDPDPTEGESAGHLWMTSTQVVDWNASAVWLISWGENGPTIDAGGGYLMADVKIEPNLSNAYIRGSVVLDDNTELSMDHIQGGTAWTTATVYIDAYYAGHKIKRVGYVLEYDGNQSTTGVAQIDNVVLAGVTL